ncbi:MFS transporter [Ancylobacter sp. FA202]|uniref:MFS transporter n=1 Tax=Ancylobacter sp. FA202 TaxID=1111106 RepID=UPI00036C0BDC|nr:MFS transporter [Ancylobacter sp. FA202]
MTVPTSGRSTLLSQAAVIATASMFGLTYSLSAGLIAFGLADQGWGEAVIGANAAMHAAGVIIVALLLPRIVPFFGMRRLVLLALVTAGVVLAAFPVLPFIALWFLLRLLLGMASEVLFVLSETWTNSLSREETRARVMAAYTAALSIGFAAGPFILSLVGTTGYLPYLAGAGVALVAVFLVASPKIEAPDSGEAPTGNPLRFLRLAPVAIAATMLNAALETSGLSFLAIYAMQLGWPETEATQLMTVMMVGAIVLQLPIGWLGDKMDRVKLVVALAVAAALGALIWPFALGHPWLTYTLLFLWGGAFVGIYTLMLAVVGSRFHGSELIGIYAAMGLMWGLGAFLGPIAAGLAMQWSANGLAFFAAAVCATFAAFVAVVGQKGRAA